MLNLRKTLVERKNQNVDFLIAQRFEWVKSFIKETEHGIEVGAGAGHSKFFLQNYSYLVTDILSNEWLDIKKLDAHNTKLEQSSYDYILVINVLHHLKSPTTFFEEANRILKVGGKIIIFEPYASMALQLALKVTKHEHCYKNADVLSTDYNLTNYAQSIWDGNNYVARQLFEFESRFLTKFPEFKLEHKSYTEFLTFINSGGLYINKSYIPLNKSLLKASNKLDKILIMLSHKIFALGIRLVLKKV
jgi:SAM-dependent methyltransferase